VWCAVSTRRIIGSIFLSRNHEIGPIRYEYTGIFEELTDDERQYGYFQQDNTTAHPAGSSVSASQEWFDDRIISTRLWNVIASVSAEELQRV
jgi:hypothetical protein